MPLIFTLLLLILVLPKQTFAEIKVDISNNMEGSSNNVTVNSSNGSNKQNSNSGNTQTNIRINNNGEIKEYKGNDGKVEIKSEDGKSSVSVNTTGVSNNSTQTQSNVSTKTNVVVNSDTNEEASPSSSPTLSSPLPEAESIKPGLLEFIKREIKQIFELFS